MNNPLLDNAALPAFSKILPEHVEPAVDTVLQQAKQTVVDLLSAMEAPTWQSLVIPMEELDGTLSPVTVTRQLKRWEMKK